MDELAPSPPVFVIGMDAGGMSNLPMSAARELFAADIIYTSRRLAGILPEDLREKCRLWPSPFDIMGEEIVSHRKAGEHVAVLVSGNPFWYGAGSCLVRHVPARHLRVLPAPSAFSLAAARLGWSLQSVETFSAHGRPIVRLELCLRPGARVLVLARDSTTPIKAAELLVARGFSASRLIILGNLGSGAERHVTASAAEVMEMEPEEIPSLHVLAIEMVAGKGAKIYPLTPGLPDDAFLHDGQITKQTVRAVTVCALSPMPGKLLWDIGAGNGTVSVEWLRAAGHGARAIALEKDPKRCARIAENAHRLGALPLQVVEGTAPAALKGLDRPDCIFIGGKTESAKIFDACYRSLKPGGILVCNAVTSGGEAALHARHQDLGGDLLRLDISQATPLGDSWAMNPALPVTQLRLRKPL